MQSLADKHLMRSKHIQVNRVYFALYRRHLVQVLVQRIEYPHILARVLDTGRVVALQSHDLLVALPSKSA
jgi:hypothetical protein